MYLNFHIDNLSALRAEGFQSGNHEYSMEIGLWAARLGAMSINTAYNTIHILFSYLFKYFIFSLQICRQVVL